MDRRTFIAGASATAMAALIGEAHGAQIPADTAGLDRTRAVAAGVNAFLVMLDGDHRAKLQFPFVRDPVASDAHFKGSVRGDVDMVGERYGDSVWSNFPVTDVPRPSLRMGALNDAQRQAVHELLRDLLSAAGYRKVQEIMGSDQALADGETPYASGRDAQTLAIFGTPGDTAPWMVQFGGHHLALNVAMMGGQGVLAPVLTGCLPAIYTENGMTIRALAAENDKAFALLASLDDGQRRQAFIDHPVSALALGPGHDGETIPFVGLAGSAMNQAQRASLFDLASEWAGILNENHAASRLLEIRAGLAETRFAWSGPTFHGRTATAPRISGAWAEALHRVFAPGARRRPDHARPHDLSRPLGRLWPGVRLMALHKETTPVHRAALAWALAAASAYTMPAVAHAAAPWSCQAMTKLALPDATITNAETVQAGAYRAPAGSLGRMASLPGFNVAGHVKDGPNPAFCRVAATLKPTADSDIKVEVWLPLSGWNGKFLGVGNFGWAGSLMTTGMLTGIGEGYAVASTDTGHDGSTPEGRGGRFAMGHPEKLVDYAYRADHLMTLDAKAVIAAFYGMGATRAYWVGCSLGGLEGLIEAKRYPEDYDGIVAGAPPNPIVDFNAAQIWPSWVVNHTAGAAMSRAKFAMLGDAVRKACASPVGLAQGFVDEPDRCGFEPSRLLCEAADAPDCLTAGQVKLVEQVYRGPVNPRTHTGIFPGPAKGGEAELAGFADGRPFPVALDLFRYAAFQDPKWDGTSIDWDKDIDTATDRLGPLLHVDADLKPFFDRGGKLLLYVGWNDYHNTSELIAYYRMLMRNAGPQAKDSGRLFAIPGMAHCFGGAGCDTFDKLGVIDAWVDRGRAPERILASKVEDGKVVRTRPLCADPEVARFTGKGNMDDAAAFDCSAP